MCFFELPWGPFAYATTWWASVLFERLYVSTCCAWCCRLVVGFRRLIFPTQTECVYIGQRNGNLQLGDFRANGTAAWRLLGMGSPIVSLRALSDGVRLVAACMNGKVSTNGRLTLIDEKLDSRLCFFTLLTHMHQCSSRLSTTACGAGAPLSNTSATAMRPPAPKSISTKQNPCCLQVSPTDSRAPEPAPRCQFIGLLGVAFPRQPSHL